MTSDWKLTACKHAQPDQCDVVVTAGVIKHFVICCDKTPKCWSGNVTYMPQAWQSGLEEITKSSADKLEQAAEYMDTNTISLDD